MKTKKLKIKALNLDKKVIAQFESQKINGAGSVPVQDCQSIGPACTFGGCPPNGEEEENHRSL